MRLLSTLKVPRQSPPPALETLAAAPLLEAPPQPQRHNGTATVDLSVVIPAFNEQRRIGRSIEAVRGYLRRSGLAWELIVVDDGSTDRTASVADEIVAQDPNVRLIRSARNGGKGNAVRAGVLASRGRDVLISDADLSTPIDELERLVASRNGAVAAVGSRAAAGARIERDQWVVRRWLGRLGNRVIRVVAVPEIDDTQCGFKLFHGPAARRLFALTRVNGWGIDVEVLHLCAKFGWPVVEVPVRWAHASGSKLRPWAYVQVLTEIAYLRLAHRRTRNPGW